MKQRFIKGQKQMPLPANHPFGRRDNSYDIFIHFDGGCSPNPGNKYGSYEIVFRGKSECRVERMNLGWGTNNEAEFEILIAALQWLDQKFTPDYDRKKFFIVMRTDSTIVRNRIGRKNKISNKPAWKERSKAMFELAEIAKKTLLTFGGFEIDWNRRDANVARFGH